MMYIHEELDLSMGKTDEFVSLFETSYEPMMVEFGARLVGLWETVAKYHRGATG